MRKIIFTILFIHCSLIIANAQWVNISCGLYDNTDAQSIVKHNSFIFPPLVPMLQRWNVERRCI